MDATPINFDTASPLGGVSPGVPAGGLAADPIARQWTALHEAAFVVAALAGMADTAPPSAVARFAEAVRQVPAGRRELAAQAVDDISAIMEPGLAALIAAHGNHGDAGAAARALWLEFVAARDAVVTMVVVED